MGWVIGLSDLSKIAEESRIVMLEEIVIIR